MRETEERFMDIGLAILLPISLIIVFRDELRVSLRSLMDQSLIFILSLTAASAVAFLVLRGRPLLWITLQPQGITALMARLQIYDKNASFNLDKIKEIAETMGVSITFLATMDSGKRLMGRSFGARARYAVILWTDARDSREGREIIKAAASAINSLSEGFKLELLNKAPDREILSILRIGEESGSSISLELGKESRRDGVILEMGERRGRVIGIPLEELTKHVLVVGQTGSGKTTTVKRLIYEAWNLGIPSLILDSHWEYRNLVFQVGGRIFFHREGYPQMCINPLSSIPKGEKEIFLVAETLSILLDLTPSQFYLLLKALRRLSDISTEKNPPNMLDLLMEVKGMSSSSQPEEESRASLVRKLEPLISGGGETLFACDNILSTKFEDCLTLLELGDIESDLQKQLLAFFVLRRIKDRFIKEERKTRIPRLIVVLEEAEKMIPHYRDSIGSELVNRLFAELRKFGVSLILVSQSLSEIPEGAIRNTGVKVIHRLDSPTDLKLIRPIAGEKAIMEKVVELSPGECLLMLPDGVESLRIVPVEELPLSGERIDEIIKSVPFYWP